MWRLCNPITPRSIPPSTIPSKPRSCWPRPASRTASTWNARSALTSRSTSAIAESLKADAAGRRLPHQHQAGARQRILERLDRESRSASPTGHTGRWARWCSASPTPLMPKASRPLERDALGRQRVHANPDPGQRHSGLGEAPRDHGQAREDPAGTGADRHPVLVQRLAHLQQEGQRRRCSSEQVPAPGRGLDRKGVAARWFGKAVSQSPGPLLSIPNPVATCAWTSRVAPSRSCRG